MYFCQLRKILLENNMTVQSEAALEEGLIKSLIQNSYEYIEVKELFRCAGNCLQANRKLYQPSKRIAPSCIF